MKFKNVFSSTTTQMKFGGGEAEISSVWETNNSQCDNHISFMNINKTSDCKCHAWRSILKIEQNPHRENIKRGAKLRAQSKSAWGRSEKSEYR